MIVAMPRDGAIILSDLTDGTLLHSMRLRDDPSAPVPLSPKLAAPCRAAFPRAALFFGLVRNHFADFVLRVRAGVRQKT